MNGVGPLAVSAYVVSRLAFRIASLDLGGATHASNSWNKKHQHRAADEARGRRGAGRNHNASSRHASRALRTLRGRLSGADWASARFVVDWFDPDSGPGQPPTVRMCCRRCMAIRASLAFLLGSDQRRAAGVCWIIHPGRPPTHRHAPNAPPATPCIRRDSQPIDGLTQRPSRALPHHNPPTPQQHR